MADGAPPEFSLLETTVEQVQSAYRDGVLSARELTQRYLDRIEAFDRSGPRINAVITIDPTALDQAARLDAALSSTGPVGPLHGVPVVLKDQIDAEGIPTTLGSVLLRDYYPDRDSFAVAKLRAAGAIILAKTTLGELGGGDTHGTLFGSTRNPYALDRTAGGSSGGSAASISANLGVLAVGQEGLASIRRPSAWNGIVGMRPTAGLVSRRGVFGGWPGVSGSLGPMSRTVQDLATLLDVIVGYDPDDPLTALGAAHIPDSYTAGLSETGLQAARIGILRESMGHRSEPGSTDFQNVSDAFDRTVDELSRAGAAVIDPVEIPMLNELLAKRSPGQRGGSEAAFSHYFKRSHNPPYKSLRDLLASPDYVPMGSIREVRGETSHEHLVARESLMINFLNVMEEHKLDAIVHRTVEHQPTGLHERANPSSVNMKGSTHLNTFLVYVPSLTVPGGFTSDGMPVGVCFMGRPYSDQTIMNLAFAYERNTMHRRPPASTPPLPGEP